MAEFIDNANQEILWKSFHKIPRVSVLDYSEKEVLFKNAIATIYHNINPNLRINREQLQELNREAMKLLLKYVFHDNNNSTTATTTTTTTTTLYESAEEITQRNFESKQKQYDKMTEKIVVPKPSELFQDIEEGAITDMDERIEEFQKQRERDLPKFDAPSSSSSGSSTEEIKIEDPLQSILVSIRNLEHRLEILENSRKGFPDHHRL
jgi:hypothetical protein